MGQDAQGKNSYRNVIIQSIVAFVAIVACLFVYNSLSNDSLRGTGVDTPTAVAISVTAEATMEVTEAVVEATPEVLLTDTTTPTLDALMSATVEATPEALPTQATAIFAIPTFIILPMLTPIIILGPTTEATPEVIPTDATTVIPTPSLTEEQTQAVIESIVERTLTAFAIIPTPTVPTSVAHIDSIPAVNGEVDPSAPPKLALGEVSAIRVEIRMNPVVTPIGGGTPKYIPSKTPTPRLGTPQATPTPLPSIASQYTNITECMEAELVGVSLNNFEIAPSPQRIMRQFDLVSTPLILQVAWWQWSIKAKGDQALGINKFAIQIYRGQKNNDGECKSLPNASPINVIDVEIEVYRTERQTFDFIWQTIVNLATALVPIGTAVGLLYGLYKFIQSHRKKNRSTGDI